MFLKVEHNQTVTALIVHTEILQQIIRFHGVQVFSIMYFLAIDMHMKTKINFLYILKVNILTVFFCAFWFGCGGPNQLAPLNTNAIFHEIMDIDKILRETIPDSARNHPAFFTTNELFQHEVRSELNNFERFPRPKNAKCLLGVSGWQNLDFASIRKPDLVLLGDFSAIEVQFNEISVKTLKVSSDRFDFINKIVSATENTPHDFNYWLPWVFDQKKLRGQWSFGEHMTDRELEIRNEATRTGSWLSNDDSFNFIKKLADEDRIIPFSLDFTNSRQFEMLSQLLARHRLSLDILYISNSLEWVERINDPILVEQYLANINGLAKRGSAILQAINVAPENYARRANKQTIFFVENKNFVLNDTRMKKMDAKEIEQAAEHTHLR